MTIFGPVTIFGNLQSKANGRQKTSWGGFRKSDKALEWLDSAAWQVKPPKEPINVPIALVGTIYYQSMRNDLDPSLLMDFLQNRGVIVNDRLFWKLDVERRIDKLRPRCEFRLDEFIEKG